MNQRTLLEVEDLLGGPGRLSLPYSLRWLLDVMTGLGVLHRTLSFVHGEVQPEHILLGEDGVGRLLPVVRAHWVRGEQRAPERLYYLAPEKLLGDSLDVRSDVFSIGVLLWEAIAGQRLLEVSDVDDILARLMSGGIPRAQPPEGEGWTAPLAAIAERALAVDPGRRFASIAAMKDAIESACSRYLASAPGMAELYGNPALRARNLVRESRPPDSQRVTLPPTIEPGSTPYAADPHNTATTIRHVSQLRPAVDPHTSATTVQHVSASDLAGIDLEDELTTKPNAAPVPVVSKARHVNTLLGVPPPFVERDSSPPDELTIPRGRISVPTAAPVVLTPLAPAPPGLSVRSQPPPRSVTPPQSFAVQPPPFVPAPRPSGPPASALGESRRAVSLAPLVAAPVERAPLAQAEPSFELVKPRKRRGALWLVLGAAAAIGLFAARPWLARKMAAATGALPDTTIENGVEPAPTTPMVTTSAIAPALSLDAPPSAGGAPAAVGIASTPPVPSGAPARSRTAAEEHLVIHDTVEPSLRELAHPTPPPPPAPTAPPAAPPPPPATPPPAPAPAPKPKEAPVSDADRYGI